MPPFIRITIALLFLFAALFSYSMGFETGLFALVVLGFIFEAGFWLGLFPIKRRKQKF
ncbi:MULTISPECIES: hypothetical protein [Alteromonas]|jgi:hypothetical protein|uniref:hypothetical protein n=1 Tax=Alteromonas TaxID=226 RepID=UPI000A459F5C|nr:MULTISPECIES: hypothetical protein [Alteromonas]